jgi:putative redox protein
MPHRTERIVFNGSQGFELAARLDLPAGKPRGYGLFAHCFSCSKDVLTAVRISKALTEHDMALLRFDFTGLGNSQGDFANTNFSSNLEDLRRAAQYLREHYQAPQLLIGHSLGGAAVLAVAADIPDVRGVATLNAPSDPSHISHFFQDSLNEITAQGEAEVLLTGRKFRIRRQFLQDLAEQRLLDKVAKLRRPLLIMHSPVDSIVNIQHAMHIFNAAKHPKNFLALDDADHMVSRPQDAAFVAAILSAWAGRYLDGFN